jgi:Restriction endonuclease
LINLADRDDLMKFVRLLPGNLSFPNRNSLSNFRAKLNLDSTIRCIGHAFICRGFIDSSKRGVWAFTEKGRGAIPLSTSDARNVFKEIQSTFAKSKGKKSEQALIEPIEELSIPPIDGVSPLQNYRDEVAEKLQAMSPAGFERFCQRLLRESGFQEVSVTGRSGDGGIDGGGVIQVNALVSFKVLFQGKRYVGTVVPSQVRDFRGAMMDAPIRALSSLLDRLRQTHARKLFGMEYRPFNSSMELNLLACLSNWSWALSRPQRTRLIRLFSTASFELDLLVQES